MRSSTKIKTKTVPNIFIIIIGGFVEYYIILDL